MRIVRAAFGVGIAVGASLGAAALVGACGGCPDVIETAVIVEASFSTDGMAVDDATVACIVDGTTIPADDTERASGRYTCSGGPGQYDVRVTRNGIVTGRVVDVPARDACGPATQTVEISVFGP